MNQPAAISPPALVILGIPFHNVSFKETVEWVRARIASRRPGYIATANIDFVMQAWRDPELQRILIEADLVVADGMPIVALSRLLGPRLKERVTGSDLVPLLARMARDHRFSIFNLGGAPGVAERAAEVLAARYPGLRVAGCYAPPMADVLHMDHEDILVRLGAAQPDLLFVAFGAPKQEKWVNLHVRRWQVPVAMGVGGSLDFLAGTQHRAPRLFQRLGLEWLWRMLSQPRRLVGRYVGNLFFFATAVLRLAAIRFARAQPEPMPEAELAALRKLAHVERFAPPADPAAFAGYAAGLETAAGARPVVMDLSDVAWLSSLDLGTLLRLATFFRTRHRTFLLIGACSRVRRLLDHGRLSGYLETASSVAAAVQRLKEESAAAAAVNEVVGLSAPSGVIIRVPEELTAARIQAIRPRIQNAMDALDAADEWIIDMTHTRFIDSAALGLLAYLKKRAVARNIPLRFTEVQPRVRQIFRIARVETLLLGPSA